MKGVINTMEVDTNFFKGNYPESCMVITSHSTLIVSIHSLYLSCGVRLLFVVVFDIFVVSVFCICILCLYFDIKSLLD